MLHVFNQIKLTDTKSHKQMISIREILNNKNIKYKIKTNLTENKNSDNNRSYETCYSFYVQKFDIHLAQMLIKDS